MIILKKNFQIKSRVRSIHSSLAIEANSLSLESVENIIDNIPGYVVEWLVKNSPNYTEDNIFKALKTQSFGAGEEQILSEYAAMKWLSINRPDFTQIIATVVDELKSELKSNTDRILG